LAQRLNDVFRHGCFPPPPHHRFLHRPLLSLSRPPLSIRCPDQDPGAEGADHHRQGLPGQLDLRCRWSVGDPRRGQLHQHHAPTTSRPRPLLHRRPTRTVHLGLSDDRGSHRAAHAPLLPNRRLHD
ncbi:hypothetical protein PMAYCL1PPCAC_04220, partial [Pristionchus mayeri]